MRFELIGKYFLFLHVYFGNPDSYFRFFISISILPFPLSCPQKKIAVLCKLSLEMLNSEFSAHAERAFLGREKKIKIICTRE